MDWRSCLSKIPEDRKANCWIAPNGDWYSVLSAEHEEFAADYIKDIYGKEFDWRKAGEYLREEYEWVYVQSDWMTGTIVHGRRHMTPDQYMVLKEYWEDRPLFRGWTISAMYKESKYYDQG